MPIIHSGDKLDVYDQHNWNPLKPSFWASICESKSVINVWLLSEDGKSTTFRSNSDWSWVVKDEGVYRQVYGDPDLFKIDHRISSVNWGADL
jgi:hypothetical protein